jgi:predicted metal-dependent phosphoesterase TrpH
MIRIDLHTHSEASIDGGLSPEDYADLLQNEILDVIAITDHDRIDFALGMQKALGADYIIVGEEITTLEGEIVGLYLKKPIKKGLSAQETVDAIHAQGGLVYIPHPFEKTRKGIQLETLNRIAKFVDIIETNNGRALTKKHSINAQTWSIKNKIPAAASSDAHVKLGIGHSYTIIASRPAKTNLKNLLKDATFVHEFPPLRSLLYPKYNRYKKMLKGQG